MEINMKKLLVAAGLLALASPALADDFYIVQNPTTKTRDAPRSSHAPERPLPR